MAHTNDKRTCHDVQTAHDHNADTVNVIGWTPGRSEQEIEHADLCNGWNTITEDKDANHYNCSHRDGCSCSKENLSN